MKMLEKLQKRLQEGKKDNKGFSLVELIIVIAIMAILIGIVGMNVIPQIENARKATDAEVISALVTEAMESWTKAEQASTSVTFTINCNNGALEASDAATNGTAKFNAAFEELARLESRTLKSTAGKKLKTIVITCSETDGVAISGTAKGASDSAPDDETTAGSGELPGFADYEFKSR